MPDRETDVGSDSGAAQVPPSRPTRPPSMFDDPLVRRLSVFAVVLVIVFLVTVLSTLVTGVLNPDQPRTRGERDVKINEQLALQNPADPEAWGVYVRSLIANGQRVRAQSVIDEARGVLDESGTEEISYMQAALHLDAGRYEDAIALAEEVRANLESYHETAQQTPNTPESKGEQIHENYWRSLIVMAEAHAALGQIDDAVASLDLYLEQKPTAADVLVRRGDLKETLGDLSGAEEDYRSALIYLPNDETVLDKLDKIGAQR